MAIVKRFVVTLRGAARPITIMATRCTTTEDARVLSFSLTNGGGEVARFATDEVTAIEVR